MADGETQNLTTREVEKLREYEEDIPAINRIVGRKLDHRRAKWSTIAQNGPIRIILLGMAGCGKSSLGNLLVGGREEKSESFTSSSSAQGGTEACKTVRAKVGGQEVEVVDTPPIGSPHFKEVDFLMNKGFHVIIVVLNVGYKRTKDMDIGDIKKVLPPYSTDCCMIVATHSASHYADKGTEHLIEDLSESFELQCFLSDINRRLVMVELRSEPISEESVIGGTVVYESERELARDMVMSMVGRVLAEKITHHKNHMTCQIL